MTTQWFKIAFSRKVVLRALKTAAIVGTALMLINHGDALLRGQLSGDRVFRILLTYLVPYLVSTTSSVSAIRDMEKAQNTASS